MKISCKTGGIGMEKMMKGLAALNGSDVLVGIPEANDRRQQLLDMKANLKPLKSGKPGKKEKRINAALKSDIGNAELLFIQTNGSPARGIPARPVIEPAIEQPDTANAIAKQLSGACVAALSGDMEEMANRLNRAGVIGEAASRKWFTNPANNWAPDAPSTIAAKGSNKPLIDTGALRRSITHVVEMDATAGNSGDEQEPATEAGQEQEAVSEAGEMAGVAESAEILVVL